MHITLTQSTTVLPVEVTECYEVPSHSHKMLLLALSCHLSASINAAPTGKICMSFDSGDFYENLSRNSNLVKSEQNYWDFYIKTWVYFIVAGNINSPQKHFCVTKYFYSVDSDM
jgi:hypothetical protein